MSIRLEPGEIRDVSIDISFDDLAIFDDAVPVKGCAHREVRNPDWCLVARSADCRQRSTLGEDILDPTLVLISQCRRMPEDRGFWRLSAVRRVQG